MESWHAFIRERSHPLAPLPTGTAPRRPRISGIRCVAFDIYGTLLISGSGDIGCAAAHPAEPALTAAFADAGLPYPRDMHPAKLLSALKHEIQDTHTRARRNGVDYPEVDIAAIWRQVLLRMDMQADAQQIRHLAVAYECRVNPVWPMPGAVETLENLRRRGLTLAIVSNAQFYTPPSIEALLGQSLDQLGFHPALRIWSFEHGVAKPSPQLFQRLGEHLAAQTAMRLADVLYVGNDLRNDVLAAGRAGCRTALFAGDARSLRLRTDDPDCRDIRPDAVVTALRDIPELIALQ